MAGKTYHYYQWMSLPEQVAWFKKLLIHTELGRYGGLITDTLTSLAVPRKILYDKMKKYGLDKSDYKG